MIESKLSNSIRWILAGNIGALVVFSSLAVVTHFAHSKVGDPNPFGAIATGLVIGQATLLGVFAACANDSFGFRMRWLYRLLAIQWFCCTVPCIPFDYDLEWPWCLLIDQLLVVVPAFMVAGFGRLVSRRVLTHFENRISKPRWKLGILDLFILTLVIAMMLAVILRFEAWAKGWDGLFYAVMVMAGIVVGAPTGALLPLALFGFMVENQCVVVRTVIVWCVAAVLGTGALFFFKVENSTRIAMFVLSVSGFGSVILTTFAFRGLGYRFRKRVTEAKGVLSCEA